LPPNADLLQSQADSIRSRYGVEARTIALDLGREDILKDLTAVSELAGDRLLVNNAGVSTVGPFLNLTADQLVKQCTLTRGPTHSSPSFWQKDGRAETRRYYFSFVGFRDVRDGYCSNYAGNKAYT